MCIINITYSISNNKKTMLCNNHGSKVPTG